MAMRTHNCYTKLSPFDGSASLYKTFREAANSSLYHPFAFQVARKPTKSRGDPVIDFVSREFETLNLQNTQPVIRVQEEPDSDEDGLFGFHM